MDRGTLYYDVSNRQAQEQDERRRHFDTMAMAVLGFSGVIVGLMSLGSGKWGSWSVLPAIGVLVSFMGVALSTFLVLWLRGWHFQPPLADLYKYMDSGTWEDEALVVWVGKQIASAIDNNEHPLRKKTLWLRVSYACLILEVITMAVFAFSVSS